MYCAGEYVVQYSLSEVLRYVEVEMKGIAALVFATLNRKPCGKRVNVIDFRDHLQYLSETKLLPYPSRFSILLYGFTQG